MGRILANDVGKKYVMGRKEHKLEPRGEIDTWGKFLGKHFSIIIA